ncbi:MAG: SLBB domain-containing protein [Oscillatoriophycideae cyanobacterium NC_groundwater_1537_Pr4_S-0.65um_50_18]|nr:SLBB domain-containing protein [Oscillatoriophycideae cyanobacterium NC_groundwater_1537_Pr4_S-0.65um_50_18]
MQISSIRNSAIALCTLAGLAACEQNNLVSQPDPSFDSDLGTSTAAAREETSAPGEAVSAQAASPLTAQSSQPERLKPESTRIKTSLGTVPTLNARRYSLPQAQPVLPRLNSAPTVVLPRLNTWRPPVIPSAPAPVMSTVPARPPGNLTASQEATASTPPANLPSSNNAPVASSQPMGTLADVQDHWSQPIVMALRNADIVQGFSDGSFRPDQPITQEQFVGMTQRAFPEEAISPESVRMRPDMTRAEAAKVVYQLLAERGRVAPLSTLVATQNQSLPTASGGEQSDAAIATSPNQPIDSPMAIAEASPRSAAADSEKSLYSETIAQPILQAAILAAEAVQASDPVASNVPSDAAPSEISEAQPVAESAAQSVAESVAQSTDQPEAQPTAPANGENASSESSDLASKVSVNVAIMGEVSRPGGYSLTSSAPTLIQAIQMAGGISPTANIRQIQVRRAGEVLTFDLWQVLQTGNLSEDLALQSGDTIAIPKAENLAAVEGSQLTPETPDRIQVSVLGEVNNPGVLELPTHTSANQAILASGGFNRQAQKADLIRLNANGTIDWRSIAVDVAQGRNEIANPRLQNNDVILVQRTDAVANGNQQTALNPLARILPADAAF